MDETQVKKLLGQKIKILRNNLNLTQFTLGEYVDIDQRQISLIEAGKSFPSLKTLVRFCEIFHCSMKDLFMFDNLQSRNILEAELETILKSSSDDKIKTLYTIAKQLS